MVPMITVTWYAFKLGITYNLELFKCLINSKKDNL